MSERFGLSFDILTEASVTGNRFVEKNRLIMRLDMAARSDELMAKLQAAPDWEALAHAIEDGPEAAYRRSGAVAKRRTGWTNGPRTVCLSADSGCGVEEAY